MLVEPHALLFDIRAIVVICADVLFHTPVPWITAPKWFPESDSVPFQVKILRLDAVFFISIVKYISVVVATLFSSNWMRFRALFVPPNWVVL